MIKKKVAEKKHEKENSHTESIDNKDDNDQVNGRTEDRNYASKEEMHEGQDVNQSVPEVPVSDKVVTEERVFEEKLAEMQDKYLRLSAEFDNYRKRTLKEKMEISKYAGEDLLKNILPIMDDFERALKHMDDSPEFKNIRDGIDLIYAKFSEFLKQQGISEIDSMNTVFNVDLHDAVAQYPVAEENRKGKVIDVVLKGYYLKDKVIRHAKVVIGE
jgi:molecular chaperone GrpE